MTDLTELEQEADREARHGHRELVKRLEARVAELEERLAAWQEQTCACRRRYDWRELHQDEQPRLSDGYTAIMFSRPGVYMVKGPGPAKRAEAEADGAHCVIAEERAEVKRMRARVAELEDAKTDAYWRGVIHARDTAWNDAIRAAGNWLLEMNQPEHAEGVFNLLRKGGSDDQ